MLHCVRDLKQTHIYIRQAIESVLRIDYAVFREERVIMEQFIDFRRTPTMQYYLD